jgi:hypothetical protein
LTNRQSIRKQGRCAIGPGVFSPSHPLRHHGVRGWPAILRARRYNGLYSARQNFTSKAPPVSLPPLDPIKGQAGDSTKGGEDRQAKHQSPSHRRRSTSQAIPFVLSLFLSETWDRLPLSQLVTPTQALRCKEIQYSPFPTGRRVFFCLNQDKPPCTLLASPSRLGTHSTNSLIGLGPSQDLTPTVGALGRGALHANIVFPLFFWMADPERLLLLATVIWFGSLEFMSLGHGYDMVLLLPRHPTDSDHELSQPRGALRRYRRSR